MHQRAVRPRLGDRLTNSIHEHANLGRDERATRIHGPETHVADRLRVEQEVNEPACIKVLTCVPKRVISCLTRAAPGDEYDYQGRIDAEVLRALLSLDDYDFYVCGPPPFMQEMYDALRSLGVRDARVFSEAFGPSAMKRRPDEFASVAWAIPEATEAIVELASSGVELSWTSADGTLLEFVEGHGVAAPYGCRGGACGSCAVRVEGEVVHRDVTADIPTGCALLCRAVPAAHDGQVRLRLLV